MVKPVAFPTSSFFQIIGLCHQLIKKLFYLKVVEAEYIHISVYINTAHTCRLTVKLYVNKLYKFVLVEMKENISTYPFVYYTNAHKLILTVYIIGLILGRIIRIFQFIRAYRTNTVLGFLIYFNLKATPTIPSANAKEITVSKVDQRG